MSGGVDSSVAAALLLKQGYEVIGATMKLWRDNSNEPIEATKSCCTLSAVEDARRVAQKLGIPHYVLNFQAAFSEKVMDYFVAEYLAGRTPNPCIACNRHMKFAGLLQKAQELEADFVATGHYAQIRYDAETKQFQLLKGSDAKKDQSYVLYHLDQNALAHYLLPLGGLTKPETRKFAAEFGFSVANKPESQEICFIPDNDYRRFLQERVPGLLKPGPFVSPEGQILGTHKGFACYTIGQRKGLGIALGQPVFVSAIDPATNRVTVGPESGIFTTGLQACDVNWISGKAPQEPLEVKGKNSLFGHRIAGFGFIPAGRKNRSSVSNSPACHHAWTIGRSLRRKTACLAAGLSNKAYFIEQECALFMSNISPIETKLLKLNEILTSMQKVVVAFSGGADSALLAAAAERQLHGNAVAVTAYSASLAMSEQEDAVKIASFIGIRHVLLPADELTAEGFRLNGPDRCYHCKKLRFGILSDWAKENQFTWIAEGSNTDDVGDYRPGMKALADMPNVRSPLMEAGFTKAEIRTLSKEWDLPTWNKPSAACLASRIAYGQPIDASKLGQVEQAEQFVRQFALRTSPSSLITEMSPALKSSLHKFLG